MSKEKTNIEKLDKEEEDPRVFRGGSWGNGARLTRVSYRYRDDASRRGNSLGFRILRTV